MAVVMPLLLILAGMGCIVGFVAMLHETNKENEDRVFAMRAVSVLVVVLSITSILWMDTPGHIGGFWRVNATNRCSLPAQVVYQDKEQMVLRFGEETKLFVRRPDWLGQKEESAPSAELAGQTWLIEEEVTVAGRALKQPVIVTYTSPTQGNGQ